MRFLFALLFGCTHANHTWPQTTKDGTHVCCLDCGKKLAYDFAGLGGLPAALPRPRRTAPHRFVFDTPGTKQFVVANKEGILRFDSTANL